MRHTKSPYIPNVKDEEDCSRFDDFEEEEPFVPPNHGEPQSDKSKKAKKRKDINFPGYTYKKEVEE